MTPRRRDELNYSDIEDTGEAVLVSPATERAVVLNPTAAAIWLLCDGKRDEAAIAAELAADLGEAAPPLTRLEQDVRTVLQDFVQNELVE